MGLIVRDGGKSFTPAPEGQHSAVCVDIIDLGMVETTWNGKTKQSHKCRIVFEISEENEQGQRHTVREQFTASLSEKAALRKFLESWRGKPFTDDELKGFDLEALWCAPALIQVVHQARGDKTYANISSIMKLPKGVGRLEPSKGYIRQKDRPTENGSNGHGDGAPPVDDDGFDPLPF